MDWRSPPSPCGPSSPASPPPLVVRGKSLSLNKVNPPPLLAPIRESGPKELSKRGRKQRLLLSQAGNLTLKRRETSPDFNRLEARLKPKRGKFMKERSLSVIVTECRVRSTGSLLLDFIRNHSFVWQIAVFRPGFHLNHHLFYTNRFVVKSCG